MKHHGLKIIRPAVLTALLAALPGVAAAHGVKTTGQPVPTVKKVNNFWSYLTNPAEAAARLSVSVADGIRTIKSDGLPDHQPGQFPNSGNPHSISSKSYIFEVPLKPRKAGRSTELGHQNFGVALNGVPFDALTAEFWNRDRSSGWNIEALSGKLNLGLDRHNAHVQPDGAYHYHGLPTGLLEQFPYRDKPALLGYAADGFPIYGPYGYQNSNEPGSNMIELRASHRVISGTRPSGPGGAYDGTYVQDYEYAPGMGDLDACNGRDGVTPEYPDGTYYYVLTASFPFIPRCWVGEPSHSGGFALRGPGSGPPGGGAGGGGHPGGRPPGMGQGPGGPPRMRPASGGSGGRQGGPPDLGAAARKLGISRDQLHRALGPPPPNFERAAQQLGISADELRRALHGQ